MQEHEKRQTEIDVLQNLIDDFKILEPPTEDVLGSFKVPLVPNCGDEEAGCQVDLMVRYREEFPEADYEILEETAEGLSDDQLSGLQMELECLVKDHIESSYDIITAL